jgi:lysophospholipase L1-like esterase
MQAAPRTARWLPTILLAVLATAAACALAEVGLRITGIAPVEFYRVDPHLGGSLVPGAEGWWTREGHAHVQINADGMRDRAHSLAKPPDTLRIAVLGDSYAEAFQVPAQEAFWSVLERELGSCPALAERSVEVLNFGVAGYGTAQELLMLRERAWRYQPDVVVLAFVTGNDVRNNARDLQGSSGRPYFVIEGDELVLDDRFARKWEVRWRNHAVGRALDEVLLRSRLFALVNGARVALRQRAEARTQAAAAAPAANELGLDDEIYRPPREPAWQQAWSLTEALLRQMRDEVVARGARFELVVLSNGIQVHPDAAERARFARALGVDELFYPDTRLAAFAAEAGISSLLLAPELRRVAEAEGACLHGFEGGTPCAGHWNALGHRAAGERIAQALCSGWEH